MSFRLPALVRGLTTGGLAFAASYLLMLHRIAGMPGPSHAEFGFLDARGLLAWLAPLAAGLVAAVALGVVGGFGGLAPWPRWVGAATGVGASLLHAALFPTLTFVVPISYTAIPAFAWMPYALSLLATQGVAAALWPGTAVPAPSPAALPVGRRARGLADKAAGLVPPLGRWAGGLGETARTLSAPLLFGGVLFGARALIPSPSFLSWSWPLVGWLASGALAGALLGPPGAVALATVAAGVAVPFAPWEQRHTVAVLVFSLAFLGARGRVPDRAAAPLWAWAAASRAAVVLLGQLRLDADRAFDDTDFPMLADVLAIAWMTAVGAALSLLRGGRRVALGVAAGAGLALAFGRPAFGDPAGAVEGSWAVMTLAIGAAWLALGLPRPAVQAPRLLGLLLPGGLAIASAWWVATAIRDEDLQPPRVVRQPEPPEPPEPPLAPVPPAEAGSVAAWTLALPPDATACAALYRRFFDGSGFREQLTASDAEALGTWLPGCRPTLGVRSGAQLFALTATAAPEQAAWLLEQAETAGMGAWAAADLAPRGPWSPAMREHLDARLRRAEEGHELPGGAATQARAALGG